MLPAIRPRAPALAVLVSFFLVFSTPLTLAQSAPVLSEPAFSAGYRVVQIPYQSSGLSLGVWYPSNDLASAQTVGSRRQKSEVALNGAPAAGPFPTILFLPGYWECGTGSAFLTQTLAEHGYVVVGIDYPEDALCASDPNGFVPSWRFDFIHFLRPQWWSEIDTFYYRNLETKAVLSHLPAINEQHLNHAMDTQRLGLLGHSLGGYSALAMGGAWPKWKINSRLKAVVSLSPFLQPLLYNAHLERIHVPVLLQGGTLDITNTPSQSEAFDRLRSPKHWIVFKGADHVAWTNAACGDQGVHACLANNPRAKAMAGYTLAFFDSYIKNDSSAMDRLTAGSPEIEKRAHVPLGT